MSNKLLAILFCILTVSCAEKKEVKITNTLVDQVEDNEEKPSIPIVKFEKENKDELMSLISISSAEKLTEEELNIALSEKDKSIIFSRKEPIYQLDFAMSYNMKTLSLSDGDFSNSVRDAILLSPDSIQGPSIEETESALEIFPDALLYYHAGHLQYAAGEYLQAGLSFLLSAKALYNESYNSFFYAAKAFSVLKMQDAALYCLKWSFMLNFPDRERFQNEPDLEYIRGSENFKEIFEKADRYVELFLSHFNIEQKAGITDGIVLRQGGRFQAGGAFPEFEFMYIEGALENGIFDLKTGIDGIFRVVEGHLIFGITTRFYFPRNDFPAVDFFKTEYADIYVFEKFPLKFNYSNGQIVFQFSSCKNRDEVGDIKDIPYVLINFNSFQLISKNAEDILKL